MYKLVSFEVKESCDLAAHQIDMLKDEVEKHIAILNKGIEDGLDQNGLYMTDYNSLLSGICLACSCIGILVLCETPFSQVKKGIAKESLKSK